MLLDWEGGEIIFTYDWDGREAPPSEAHRILIRPEGWSADRFAKVLKALVGW